MSGPDSRGDPPVAAATIASVTDPSPPTDEAATAEVPAWPVRTRKSANRARKEAVELQRALAGRSVTAVMVTVVVHSGATVAKCVPLDRLDQTAAAGVGLSPVSDAFGSTGAIDEEQRLASPDGDLRLVPDLAMVRQLAPGWAWAPADRYEQDGTPYSGDQRLFARRMIRELEAAGVSGRGGFEIEWAVGGGSDDSFVPAFAGGPYSAARVLAAADYSRDVIASLGAAGIDVLQFHAEYAPGQFEVALPTTDLLTAADHHVLARLVIADVSRRHGVRSSFSPAVIAGSVGSGGHLHLSLVGPQGPLFGGGSQVGGLTDVGASVVAALVAHTPALLAVGCPLAASYDRLRPNRWAGAFQMWGIENREAAVRLVPGAGDPATSNLEVKTPDLAANPYLLVGAVLAIVRDGLRTHQEPPAPVVGVPADGSQTRLPSTLWDATQAFRVDAVLADALGADLHTSIAENREAEVRRTHGWSIDDVVASTRWWI